MIVVVYIFLSPGPTVSENFMFDKEPNTELGRAATYFGVWKTHKSGLIQHKPNTAHQTVCHDCLVSMA